jgi:hypothetical protein
MSTHLAFEAGGDEITSRGEPPVEGGDTNPSPPGDVLQRDVETALGEDGLGGDQNSLAISPGVRSQGRAGHPPTLLLNFSAGIPSCLASVH